MSYKDEIIDKALFICVDSDKSEIIDEVINEAKTLLTGPQFSFHAHVAIITIDENLAWNLCAFASINPLSNEHKDWLAQQIEFYGIDYYYWVNDKIKTIAIKQANDKERRWDYLLSMIHKGEKINEIIDKRRKFDIREIKME